MAPPKSGMKLTFGDEFDSLDLYSTWKPTDQWGNRYLSGNSELQLYVDPKYKGLGLNPFSINDGVLTIKAAKSGGNASTLGKQYTSGMLSSHGTGGFSQQYGYFEMRAQLPAGKGMWPAFWLLSDSGKWPPELDVMESIGSLDNYAVQSIHSKDGNKGKTTWTSENLQQGFHTYGMNWTADTITYYIDGQEKAKYATPSDMHGKMHMLLNLAVGGSWPGSPDSTTDWSKTNYKIDYVRVYSDDPKAVAVPTTASSGSTSSNSGSAQSTAPDPAPSSGSATTFGPGLSPYHVVLSNTMDVSDLSDTYRTANDVSRTYSASQMGIDDVVSPTSVSVAYSSKRDITVTNNGEWGDIRNAIIGSGDVRNVTINNFVDAEISLGDTARTITVTDAKRGNIRTGAGSDTITVTGTSNAASGNLLTINAGDGNNTVSYTGEDDNRVRVNTGSGNDTITIRGATPTTVVAGGGNDRINFRTTNGATLTGGTGRDVFSFAANAHATIADFSSADDRIELSGVSASSVRVSASGGSTYIDIGSSGRITVSGVTHTAAGLHLSYV